MKTFEMIREDDIPVDSKYIRNGQILTGLNPRMFAWERLVFEPVEGTIEEQDMFIRYEIDWTKTKEIIASWIADEKQWRKEFLEDKLLKDEPTVGNIMLDVLKDFQSLEIEPSTKYFLEICY
jgi:hypothetical protein